MYTPLAIGAPNTYSATRVLLLGAGELGRELTIALQRMGVEVHAADRYQGAPAHNVANKSYVLDLMEADGLRELIEQVRPHFIVPEIEALAVDVLEEVEDAGVATVTPTAKAAALTMDRERIRTMVSDNLGIPTCQHQFASTPEELHAAAGEIGFPCVVKPVISSAGRGQSYIGSEDELDAAWDYALSKVRVPCEKVIVEQFVPFDYEITLLTVRSIDPASGQDATWFCEPIGHRQDQGEYVESWQPATMGESALDNARSVAARVTNALGGRGVFGVELFVKGDDVYFSEVSPRPHDTGMVTMGTQRFSEFDLHARAILGLPIDTTLISPGASVVIRSSDLGGCTAEYTGLAQALAVPETDVRMFGKPHSYNRRRMGVAVATAETIEEARDRAADAADAIVLRPAPEPDSVREQEQERDRDLEEVREREVKRGAEREAEHAAEHKAREAGADDVVANPDAVSAKPHAAGNGSPEATSAAAGTDPSGEQPVGAGAGSGVGAANGVVNFEDRHTAD